MAEDIIDINISNGSYIVRPPDERDRAPRISPEEAGVNIRINSIEKPQVNAVDFEEMKNLAREKGAKMAGILYGDNEERTRNVLQELINFERKPIDFRSQKEVRSEALYFLDRVFDPHKNDDETHLTQQKVLDKIFNRLNRNNPNLKKEELKDYLFSIVEARAYVKHNQIDIPDQYKNYECIKKYTDSVHNAFYEIADQKKGGKKIEYLYDNYWYTF